MEKIFWVKNGELREVNNWLQKGGRVKMIKAVSETIAAYGYAGGETSSSNYDHYEGDIYAYIVVEFD